MFSPMVTLTLAALIPATFADILDVEVGPNGQLVYDPPFVHAQTGDIVRFHFNPKNHTVTQSAFDPPCIPLAGDKGFNTGFVPVAAGTNPLPFKDFTVQDTKNPIWFYCGQGDHCGSGMVFAINPTDPRVFAAFKGLSIARNGTSASATPSAYDNTDTGYATPTYRDDASSSPAPQNHLITVGADGQLAYSPANISAAVGDTVTFEFMPKNHTVTQSSFSNPCVSLPNGFNSGFQPVAADATVFPTFIITIKDTAPIWGYCDQVSHCQSGMVFSINADKSGGETFAAFRQLAMSGSASSSASTNAT